MFDLSAEKLDAELNGPTTEQVTGFKKLLLRKRMRRFSEKLEEKRKSSSLSPRPHINPVEMQDKRHSEPLPQRPLLQGSALEALKTADTESPRRLPESPKEAIQQPNEKRKEIPETSPQASAFKSLRSDSFEECLSEGSVASSGDSSSISNSQPSKPDSQRPVTHLKRFPSTTSTDSATLKEKIDSNNVQNLEVKRTPTPRLANEDQRAEEEIAPVKIEIGGEDLGFSDLKGLNVNEPPANPHSTSVEEPANAKIATPPSQNEILLHLGAHSMFGQALIKAVHVSDETGSTL